MKRKKEEFPHVFHDFCWGRFFVVSYFNRIADETRKMLECFVFWRKLWSSDMRRPHCYMSHLGQKRTIATECGMNKWNRTWKRFLDCNTIWFYFMRIVVFAIANLDMLIIIYLFINVFTHSLIHLCIHSFIRSFSFTLTFYCIYSPWSSR